MDSNGSGPGGTRLEDYLKAVPLLSIEEYRDVSEVEEKLRALRISSGIGSRGTTMTKKQRESWRMVQKSRLRRPKSPSKTLREQLA